jgi:hypothetical protein
MKLKSEYGETRKKSVWRATNIRRLMTEKKEKKKKM